MAKLNRVAIWHRVDGGVSITNFDDIDMLPGESEDEFIRRTCLKHGQAPQLKGVIPVIVPDSEIPTDKTYRDEWTFKDGKIVLDAVKVKKRTDKELNSQSAFAKVAATAKLSPDEQAAFEEKTKRSESKKEKKNEI